MAKTDIAVKVTPCVTCGLTEPEEPVTCHICQRSACAAHALVCEGCDNHVCLDHAIIDEGDETGEDADDLIGKPFCDECLEFWTELVAI